MNSYYTRYYLIQSGGNLNDIGELYRSPLIYQRGRGIGSFFSGLLRYLQPIVSSGAKVLKQQAIKTGKAILEDAASKPMKDILREQGKAAAQELAQKGINKLFDHMDGAGRSNRMTIKRPNPFTTARFTLVPKRKKRSKQTTKKASSKKKKSIKDEHNFRKRVLDIFDK